MTRGQYCTVCCFAALPGRTRALLVFHAVLRSNCTKLHGFSARSGEGGAIRADTSRCIFVIALGL